VDIIIILKQNLNYSTYVLEQSSYILYVCTSLTMSKVFIKEDNELPQLHKYICSHIGMTMFNSFTIKMSHWSMTCRLKIFNLIFTQAWLLVSCMYVDTYVYDFITSIFFLSSIYICTYA